jgi:hypothetical protein
MGYSWSRAFQIFDNSVRKDKIVKLFKTSSTDWAEYNLIWKDKDIISKSEIVFTTDQEK